MRVARVVLGSNQGEMSHPDCQTYWIWDFEHNSATLPTLEQRCLKQLKLA